MPLDWHQIQVQAFPHLNLFMAGPSPLDFTKEQNQASKEGANLSGGGCGVHPHKKREEE